MWGFIKSIFTGKTDDVMDIAKGVGGWIDEQQFTDEEKSKASMEMLNYKLKWLNATRGMNVARRALAIMFSVSFLLTFLASVITAIVGFAIDKDVKPLINEIVQIVQAYQIGWIVVTMIVFYFGKGIAETAMNKAGRK